MQILSSGTPVKMSSNDVSDNTRVSSNYAESIGDPRSFPL